MKLYLECSMGAAGDMLMGALLELLPDRELFLKRMQNLGLPNIRIDCEPMVKCGVTGTKMRVRIGGVEEHSCDFEPSTEHKHTHDHPHGHDHKHAHNHPHSHESSPANGSGHQHYSYADICALIENLDLAENVKREALSVYRLISEAESAVHGVAIEEIHLHEVGAMDAVVDIVGCCLLFQMLGVETIEASPVHVGSGFVRCAHGVLPVPAPATAYILKDVPIYGGKIKGELCTPTGAALLKHFVKRFGEMEPMAAAKIGYGMGTKDFEAANCLRAFLSERTESKDMIVEIVCNLDDMTPESIGFTTEFLLEKGALDVFTTPIYMKKSRPAVMLTCLCRPEDKHEMARLILEQTATLGVRFHSVQRQTLDYIIYSVDTPYGEIRIKSASGYGITKEKPEYEDVRAAAKRHNVPFNEVYSAAASMMKLRTE